MPPLGRGDEAFRTGGVIWSAADQNIKTGQILWSFASGGAVGGCAAIVGNEIFSGSGDYFIDNCVSSANPLGLCIASPSTAKIGANNKLYAFSPTSTLPEEANR